MHGWSTRTSPPWSVRVRPRRSREGLASSPVDCAAARPNRQGLGVVVAVAVVSLDPDPRADRRAVGPVAWPSGGDGPAVALPGKEHLAAVRARGQRTGPVRAITRARRNAAKGIDNGQADRVPAGVTQLAG